MGHMSNHHLPTICHPTDRPNFCEVTVGDLSVYFSYQTPIAFYTPKTGRVVRQNDWSTTTGKHLNHCDGGSADAKRLRLPSNEFTDKLAEVAA